MQAFWKTLLIVATTLAFVAVIMAGMEVFYKSPEYKTYFPEPQRSQAVMQDKEQCEASGGAWNVQGVTDKPRPAMPPGEISAEQTGWCDQNFKKQQEYDHARAAHDRIAFITLMVLGTLAFLAGGASIYKGREFSPMAAVASGIAIGGIILMIIDIARYWGAMNDKVKFALLVAILVVIIGSALFTPRIFKRFTRV